MNDEFPLMAFIANEGWRRKANDTTSSLVNDTAGKLYKKTDLEILFTALTTLRLVQ